MTTKLRIDTVQGIIDVEGDPQFVREIYADFKELMHSLPFSKSSANSNSNDNAESAVVNSSIEQPSEKAKPKGRRRTPVRRKSNGVSETGEPTINVAAPRIDKNLDTVKLRDYYNKYAPRNAPEKILIFLKFITEELEIEAPNTDQVYTCFKAVDEKVPGAFGQAFINASSRSGFIDYKSPTEITIPIKGDNHFRFELPKRESE
ncbi:hypothetical protein ACYX78_00185 [Advenella incenata]